MRDFLAKILYEYFANLDGLRLETICFDLIAKFAENKSLEIEKNTHKILILYAKQENKKLKISFKLWRSFKNNKSSSKGRNKSALKNIKSTNNTSKNVSNVTKYFIFKIRESNPKNNFTSTEIKEEKDYRNCTFRPKINDYDSLNRSSTDAFDRLYSDHQRKNEKKIANMMEFEEIENKKMPFNPIINNSSKIRKSISKDKFFRRQEQVKILR